MSQEDFYKPTNIGDSMFEEMDLPEILPEISWIKISTSKKYEQAPKINKYTQDDEDDEEIGLGFSRPEQKSRFQVAKKYEAQMTREFSDFTLPLPSQKQKSPQKSQTQKLQPRKSQPQKSSGTRRTVQQVRRLPANLKGDANNKKQEVREKNVVDLDNEIGEVREWAHRDESQEQSDFDKSQQEEHTAATTDKQVQNEMRKIAQQKAHMLKMKIQNKPYTGHGQSKPMGLQAKLKQLKKINEQNSLNPNSNSKDKLPQIQLRIHLQQSTDKLNVDSKPQQIILNPKKPSQSLQKSQQTKTNLQPPKFQASQQSEDDPWEKINQQTKQQYQKKQDIKANPLTKQQVIDYYSKKFLFAQEDIQVQFELEDFDEQQVVGCWEALFGCLKSKDEDPKKKNDHKNSKDRIAMRLVAISKINLTNTDEEFFILKEIWTKLTTKPFSRYGNHWNDIGFQGRDPATDLRSTGVLSLLQWYLFIEDDFSSAKKIYEWTVKNDFPLALTHIKATGLFLKLLKNGKIRAKSWNEYQKYYNCISWSVFNKIQKSYDSSDNVGEVVDLNLQSIGKNISQCLKQYEKIKNS